jgi:plastocyanin
MRVFAVIALILLAAGCGRSSSSAAPAPAEAPPSAPTVTQAPGQITGRVFFKGAAPVMHMVLQEVCTVHDAIVEEYALVNANGTLKNVLVYLKETPDAAPPASPAAPAVLDQIGCQYVPHVMALRVGQKLTIKSSDDTLHNVHIDADANPTVNLPMSGVGSRELTFAHPEILRVHCDVHPWMHAWVGVFDHPYFAVTGDDGSFQIKDVPPGSYTLLAWHEHYGPLEQAADVAAAASTHADFTYTAP